eukprot:Selendium_serpulae@DN2539_c0_g1_i1.p1
MDRQSAHLYDIRYSSPNMRAYVRKPVASSQAPMSRNLRVFIGFFAGCLGLFGCVELFFMVIRCMLHFVESVFLFRGIRGELGFARSLWAMLVTIIPALTFSVLFCLLRIGLPLYVCYFWLQDNLLRLDREAAAAKERPITQRIESFAKSICTINCTSKELFDILMNTALLTEWQPGHGKSIVFDSDPDSNTDFIVDSVKPDVGSLVVSAGTCLPAEFPQSVITPRHLCRRRYWKELPHEDNKQSCFLITSTSSTSADSRLMEFMSQKPDSVTQEVEDKMGAVREMMRDGQVKPYPQGVGLDSFLVVPWPDGSRRCSVTYLTGIRYGGFVPLWVSQQLVLDRCMAINGLQQFAESADTPTVSPFAPPSDLVDHSSSTHENSLDIPQLPRGVGPMDAPRWERHHEAKENKTRQTKQWIDWFRGGGESAAVVAGDSAFPFSEEDIRRHQPSRSPKIMKARPLKHSRLSGQMKRSITPPQATASPSLTPVSIGPSFESPLGASTAIKQRSLEASPTAAPERSPSDVLSSVTEMDRQSAHLYDIRYSSPNMRAYVRKPVASSQAPMSRNLRVFIGFFAGCLGLFGCVELFFMVIRCMLHFVESVFLFRGIRGELGFARSLWAMLVTIIPALTFSVLFCLLRIGLPLYVCYFWLQDNLLRLDREAAAAKERPITQRIESFAKSICTINCTSKELFDILMNTALLTEWQPGHGKSIVFDSDPDSNTDFIVDSVKPDVGSLVVSAGTCLPAEFPQSVITPRHLCRRRYWKELPHEDNKQSCFLITSTSSTSADSRLMEFMSQKPDSVTQEVEDKMGAVREMMRDGQVKPYPQGVGLDSFLVVPWPDGSRRCSVTYLTGIRYEGFVPLWVSRQLVLSRCVAINGLKNLAESLPNRISVNSVNKSFGFDFF